MQFLKTHGISILAFGLAVAALILSITKSSGKKSSTGLFGALFTTKWGSAPNAGKKAPPPPPPRKRDPNDPADRDPKNWSHCPGWQCGEAVSDDLKVWSPRTNMRISRYIHGDTCGNYKCVNCENHNAKKRWVHKTWGSTSGSCHVRSSGVSGGGGSGGGS